ncbi:hypothetical protein [Streptomyces sp. A012304]|uniref:hypothetical protein n=1 Tax=Streptomyces sp. A012304 TaxID=375446 RepID=UPI00222F4661|nr:hypothetical protein [Streptomyces sp. A012304]GKQ39517.1 hypothetical protein ALMP_60440 [Streptomyces sp. A012304]
MSARDELATPPDFFRPGRTYTTDEPFRAPEDRPNFQCVAVAIHPTMGSRRALGFEQPGSGRTWKSASLRDDEWADGWVDVTEGGAGVPQTMAVDPDRLYRDAYATGRDHAGALGWRLNAFTPVFTRSDGTDKPVSELRCTCGVLLQHVGEASLLDLAAMAARHDCQDGSR